MLAAYLKADEIIEKLYRNNPSQYKIERITIYQLLAAAYYELDLAMSKRWMLMKKACYFQHSPRRGAEYTTRTLL